MIKTLNKLGLEGKDLCRMGVGFVGLSKKREGIGKYKLAVIK